MWLGRFLSRSVRKACLILTNSILTNLFMSPLFVYTYYQDVCLFRVNRDFISSCVFVLVVAVTLSKFVSCFGVHCMFSPLQTLLVRLCKNINLCEDKTYSLTGESLK